MKVGDQAADVARAVLHVQCAAAEPVEKMIVGRRKRIAVGLVHRIVFSLLGHANVFVRQHIGPDRRIERETVDAAAHGVDQHG